MRCVAGAVKVCARVLGLQWPGTREEEGAGGAEGTVAGEKGEAGEAKEAAVFWGQEVGVHEQGAW